MKTTANIEAGQMWKDGTGSRRLCRLVVVEVHPKDAVVQWVTDAGGHPINEPVTKVKRGRFTNATGGLILIQRADGSAVRTRS